MQRNTLGLALDGFALLLALAFGLVLILANPAFLSPNAVLTQDFAASSIGTWRAAHFQEIYGTPSFNGYFHPGPVLAYWRALFDGPLGMLGLPPPATTFIAHAALLVFVLVGSYLLLVRSLAVSRVGAIAFCALMMASLALAEGTLASVWEPHIAAVLAFPALVLVAVCRGGRMWAPLLQAIVLLSMFQIQLTTVVFCAVVAVLSLTAFANGVAERSEGQFWAAMLRVGKADMVAAAIFVLILLPIVLDILTGARNLRDFFTYSAASGGSSQGLSLFASLDMSDRIMWQLPWAYWSGVVLVAMAGLVTYLTRNRPESAGADLDTGMSDRLLITTAAAGAGAMAAPLFLGLFATQGYAPPHATQYLLTCFAILIISVFIWSLERLSVRWRTGAHAVAASAASLLLLMSAAQGFMTWNPGPAGVFLSSALKAAAAEITEQATASPTRSPVSLLLVFQSSGTLGERENPWSVGIGLANLLTRAGVDTCINGTPDQMNQLTMSRFTRAPICAEPHSGLAVTVRCEGGAIVLFTGEKRWVAGPC